MADLSTVQTPRMRALQQLSAQIPVANQQVAQGQQAARDIQLQQAVKQSKPGAAINSTAQQAGAAMQQAAGQQQVDQATQNLKQGAQLQDSALKEQQQVAGQQAFSGQQGLEQQKQDQVSRFADLSQQAKKELFDDQIQFARDQSGQAILNERQLADYARMKAQSNEDFKDYAQKSDQLTKRKLAMSQAIQQKLEQGMKQTQAELGQIQDQISQGKMSGDQMATARKLASDKAAKLEELQQQSNDYLAHIQDETSKAQSNMAQNVALFTIAGSATGAGAAVLTGQPELIPAGISAGGSGGAALGAGATQKGLI